MHIHEYQAKKILKSFDVKLQEGGVAKNTESALALAEDLLLESESVAVKAQVHSGARGKAGGIKIAKSSAEVKAICDKMLGMRLITKQNGPDGERVNSVYIESCLKIKSEIYLSIILDREKASWTIVASNEGGVDIEKVASSSPEKIIKIQVRQESGLQPFHIRKLMYFLNIEHKQNFSALIKKLFAAFISKDMEQLEINPLALTYNDEYIPLDAKITLDDNALFRQEGFAELKGSDETRSIESEAKKYSLNYIKLNGSIGCMVNGAGLAMATMDIINMKGGSAANFLDVGGDATQEKVRNAFKIILSDKSVKGVLVNIFGGIIKCDVIAEGLIEAVSQVNLSLPLVVRLDGTNAEIAKKILQGSGLQIHTASNLTEAAQMIVKLIS